MHICIEPKLDNFHNIWCINNLTVFSLKVNKSWFQIWDHQGKTFIHLPSQAIMKNLVRRYVTQEQQKAENEGVTEDDVNEIKNDISAFRFELIEIMRQSGMKVSSSSGLLGKYRVTIQVQPLTKVMF